MTVPYRPMVGCIGVAPPRDSLWEASRPLIRSDPHPAIHTRYLHAIHTRHPSMPAIPSTHSHPPFTSVIHTTLHATIHTSRSHQPFLPRHHLHTSYPRQPTRLHKLGCTRQFTPTNHRCSLMIHTDRSIQLSSSVLQPASIPDPNHTTYPAPSAGGWYCYAQARGHATRTRV